MAVDPVPYVVHGAKHSADVFRQAHFDATSGGEGISLPANLRVKATGTPSGQVQVAPGGATIVNSYAGGTGQSYSARNASTTLVDVPASDSTGAKSWKIILRVSDPQFGGQAPVDPLVGPYTFIECVASSAVIAAPHIVLAGVVVPANTAAVTNAMITDRRELANPLRKELVFGRPRVAEDGSAGETLKASVAAGGEYFPGGGSSANQFYVTPPEWANQVMIEAYFLGVRYAAATNPYGEYWVEFGDEYRDHGWPNNKQLEFATQHFRFDSPGSSNNTMRTNWILMDSIPVRSKLRGTQTTFAFKAGVVSGSGDVSMDGLSGLGCRLTFAQVPETDDLL